MSNEEFLKQVKNTFGHIASLIEEGRSTNKKAKMELEYIEKQIIEREIQNQPEVDEEFVEKWVEKLGIKVRQRWSDDYYVNPSRKDLKEMLKEAGVKVKKQ